MERLLKRLVVLSLLISTGAMAHNNNHKSWEDFFRMVRLRHHNHGHEGHLNLLATRSPSSSTPQLVSFQGLVKIPNDVHVSLGANLLGQGARLIFDDGRVECRYQQRTGGKFKLSNCTDGSRANDEFRVDQNMKFELLPVLVASKAVVKIHLLERADETYGVQFPYLTATEGQVLAYNGEAWVPMNAEDVFDGGGAGTVGPQGPAGPVGPVGPQGPAGADGAVGSAGAVGPQGPAGPAGATGAVGPQGPAGATGAQGPVGATGPQGPKGDKGDKGDAGADGAPGVAGATGATGATGAEGPQGPAGATGAQGPQGPVGAMGAQGPIGPVGPQGPAGPAGADAVVNTGTGPGQIPVLDANGQLPSSVLPAGAGGGGVKVAFIKDVKAPSTNGGTCFASWQNRDLNTLEGDSSFAAVSANQITLQPGTYWFEGHAPGYFAGAHQAKLVNVATNADVSYGSSGHSHPSAGSVTHSIIKVRLVLSAATTYKIQQRCSIERALQGLGIANGFGGPETYTTITIVKLD